MLRILKILFFLLFVNFSAAQNGEAVLILKDSTRIKGYGEISGISSIVSIKFKNDSLKYRTYDQDEIIGIDIKEYDYYRKYRYKKTDTSNYPELLESILTDSVSLYIKIFGNGSIPNRTYFRIEEKTKDKFEGQPENTEFYKWLKRKVNTFVDDEEIEIIEEDLSKKILLSQAFSGYYFERVSYYIIRKKNEQAELIYTKGLPFSKSFKKSIKKKFSDCPELISLVEDKTISEGDIVKALYFYNNFCLN